MTIYEHETAVISASETGQYKHKYCTCTCTIKYRRIQYPFAFTYSGLYDLFHTLQKVENFDMIRTRTHTVEKKTV